MTKAFQELANNSTEALQKDIAKAEAEVLFEDADSELDAVSTSSRLRFKQSFLRFVTVFVVLLLGFGSFFLWPREPEVSLVSFKFDESNPTSPDETGELFTNWKGELLVKSANYINIGVRDIKVNAFLPSNMKVAVGKGGVSNVTIKGRSETAITLNFLVPVYKPSSGKPSLLEECMNAAQVPLLIQAEIDLNLLHWTGQKIRTSLIKNVDCALPELYQLTQKLNGPPNLKKKLTSLKAKK